MLCKQTLMCFEDLNVSQEEKKNVKDMSGMRWRSCKTEREFSVSQDGCES